MWKEIIFKGLAVIGLVTVALVLYVIGWAIKNKWDKRKGDY